MLFIYCMEVFQWEKLIQDQKFNQNIKKYVPNK